VRGVDSGENEREQGFGRKRELSLSDQLGQGATRGAVTRIAPDGEPTTSLSRIHVLAVLLRTSRTVIRVQELCRGDRMSVGGEGSRRGAHLGV